MIRAGEKAQPPLRNGAPVSPDGGPLVQGDALSFACEPGDRIWTVSLDAPAIGVLVIDPESHEATVDGVPVSLPATEQRALAYLHKHRNLLVPYVDLADHLFPGEYPDRLDKAAHNRLSQVISRLRKAIEPGAFTSNGRQAREWRYLTTSHRRGVRLVYGADLASTQIATRTPNNLGAPDPHFVGRTTERWELRRLLQDFRIVTIHGIGGIGKTSLALRAAADMLTVFPGGVWHLNLLALAQDSELEEYAASVIAGGRAGRPPLERLQRALGDRPALLVLDNCEHVAAGARDVIQRLLFRCVNLRVLTTSRRPLWLSGEARLPLQPLTLPGETDPWSRAANPTLLEQDYDAIRLFVRQARSSRADFELNEANAEAIVNICRRLEGVPLALTLAAPHLRLLTVQELERRLDQRLRLLSARHGDAGRHGTMQAAIAWAHDQLSEPARALLARIAVFAGDASLAAVQQVCSFAPVPADSLEQYLEELLDHGLVTATAFQGETRISMLALVHEFAAERLNERAGERDILEARRLAFYRTLVRGSTHSQGSERERARGLLRREGPNLRDALAHARALGNPSAAVELVAGLAEHWIELGFWREATDWLDYAVAELRDDEPADLSAQIFECAGRIAVRMGDLGRAADMLARCLYLRERLEDTTGMAAAHTELAIAAAQQYDFPRARHHFEVALELWRKDDLQNISATHNGLGFVAWNESDLPRAIRAQEHALALRRQAGDRLLIANSLNNLGVLVAETGDLGRAEALFQEAYQLRQAITDKVGLIDVGTNICNLYVERGDNLEEEAETGARQLWYQQGATFGRMAVALARELGNSLPLALALTSLGIAQGRIGKLDEGRTCLREALLLRDRGTDHVALATVFLAQAEIEASTNPNMAVRLLSGVDRLWSDQPVKESKWRLAQFERLKLNLMQLCSPKEFNRAWAAGATVDTTQLIALATRTAPV